MHAHSHSQVYAQKWKRGLADGRRLEQKKVGASKRTGFEMLRAIQAGEDGRLASMEEERVMSR